MIPNSSTAQYNQTLRVVEDFLRSLHTGFPSSTGNGPSLRSELENALNTLLVWNRSRLQREKGLAWIYEELAQSGQILERLARSPGCSSEAELFLSLLPFPRQWDRLGGMEISPNEEVRLFLARESHKISKKIQAKDQDFYKLRHFCQILKAPGPQGEKGVLRVFSIPYLFLDPELLSRVGERFQLFLEPPMGLVFRHAWWRRFTCLDTPPLFGVGGWEDAAFLADQPNTRVIRLAHGDFLLPSDRPCSTRRAHPRYDIVFNATFDDMPRKRHGHMLRLLLSSELRDRTTLFLGRGSNNNVKMFMSEVERLGLKDRVTALSNIKRSEIPNILAQCRMGVHLSLYENAPRCIYEFFRAGLPCVVSSAMAGLNFELFTDATGRAVPDAMLASAIASVLEDSNVQPAQWFAEKSGSANSSRRLEVNLRDLFREHGIPWTRDMVPLSSSGASRYAVKSDLKRFQGEFEWLAKTIHQFGRLPVPIIPS